MAGDAGACSAAHCVCGRLHALTVRAAEGCEELVASHRDHGHRSCCGLGRSDRCNGGAPGDGVADCRMTRLSFLSSPAVQNPEGTTKLPYECSGLLSKGYEG